MPLPGLCLAFVLLARPRITEVMTDPVLIAALRISALFGAILSRAIIPAAPEAAELARDPDGYGLDRAIVFRRFSA